jgi:hypothetical protein
MLNRPWGHRDGKMLENQVSRELMERLVRVDSKLEKLLTSQIVNQKEEPADVLPVPDGGGAQEIGPALRADDDVPQREDAASLSPKPLKFNATISPAEADTILQKVQRINNDAELMERIIRLEKQNRKITILGSMFMTLVVLILAAFTVLMVQANIFHKGVSRYALEKVDSPKPSAGKETAPVTEPQPAGPLAEVKESPAAGSVTKESDPKPVESAAPITETKSSKETAPVKYVGSITSNKYHYPNCKWAATIKPYKLRNFSSVKEARENGYIPCPTCRPPGSDEEELSTR